MKIAFCSYDAENDVSGISTWLQRLLPCLQAAGYEVEAYLLSYSGKPEVNCAFYKAHGIPYRCAPRELFTEKSVRHLLRFMEESQPDIFVANSIAAAFFAASYARAQGIATVGVLHADDPFSWAVIDEFCGGDPSLHLSAMVGVSTFLEATLQKSAAKEMLVRCIGCGVPIPENSERGENPFRLIYVGRLTEEQKRISEVTKALCAATKLMPEVEAWIVGDGDARPSVEKILKAEDPDSSRVRMLGRIDNSRIYDVLRDCHALVLLSDYEGLPVSMLEAMAAGVVPICLDMRSGIREVIENRRNGMIVKDREGDFLAAVQSLHEDRTFYRQLSRAARTTIEEQYSVQACAERWMELFRTLQPPSQERRPFRAPVSFTLPRPNPKFGLLDMRDSLRQRAINRLLPIIRRLPFPLLRQVKKMMGYPLSSEGGRK